MSTSDKHLYKKQNFLEYAIVPIDQTNAINEESMVFWQPSTNAATSFSDSTNASNCIGVLMDKTPINLYGTTTSPNAPIFQGRVARVGQFAFKATSGNTLAPFTYIGIGADAQTVATGPASVNALGFVSPEQATITSATAGQAVLIEFRAPYPSDVRIAN